MVAARAGPQVEEGMEVVRRWVECLERGDLSGAERLYAPETRFHIRGCGFVGDTGVRQALVAAGIVPYRPLLVEIHGQGTRHTVWWWTPARRREATRFRVEGGRIVEQWMNQEHE